MLDHVSAAPRRVPEWYVAASIRAMASLASQGVSDRQLMTAWRAYQAAAPNG